MSPIVRAFTDKDLRLEPNTCLGTISDTTNFGVGGGSSRR